MSIVLHKLEMAGQLINHAGNVELIPPKVLAGRNRGQADGTAMTPGAFSV